MNPQDDPVLNRAREHARQQSAEEKMKILSKQVRQEAWYKERIVDRCYTKEHAKRHCKCTRPKDWLFTVIEIQ